MKDRNKRAAIIYSSIGTGHKTAANALCEWFSMFDVDTICVDALAYVNPIIRGIYARSYLEMVRKAPQIWGYFYESTDSPEAAIGLLGGLHELTVKLNARKLLKVLVDFSPDAIIFTHFFAAAAVAQEYKGKTPIFLVNTDFLSHVFHRDRDIYDGWFVASEEALLQYEADGIDIEKVYISGIPIKPCFMTPPSKRSARDKLRLSQDGSVFLVMGGGIGVGPLEDVVESLSQIREATVLTLCGNNEELREAMKERFFDSVNVKVFGFVKGMEYVYAASDAIVMKPGGLSTSEVLCMKRPFFLCGVIPGQEQRNSDYLLDRGAAKTIFEPRRAAHTLLKVLGDEGEQAKLLEASEKLARPKAGEAIVKKVLEFI